MREYKKRLEDIKALLDKANEMSSEALHLEYAVENSGTILGLFDEAKKLRRKAERYLCKVAFDLGFDIIKDVKNESDFMSVWYSLNRRVEKAMEILYSSDWCEINIKPMEYGN